MRKTIFLFLFLTFKLCFALTITEIMYNPEGNDSGREWIEALNNTSEIITILGGRNGWRINDGKNHLFEENLTIFPDEIFIIVQDKNFFLKDYPNFQGKIIQANFSLKNESGKIQIFDENKRLRAEISYQNSCGGDGNGYSIFFKNGLCQENKVKGGTPGNLLVKDKEEIKIEQKEKTEIPILPISVTSTVTSSILSETSTEIFQELENFVKTEEKTIEIFQPTIIISEFLPNPKGNDQGKEFVEIYNYGDEVLSLDEFALWIGKKKINLSGKIEPQEYFLITNKDYNFYIRNQGEDLKLYFDNKEIFSISYNGRAPEGKSFSRKEDNSWEFTEPTPGKENVFHKKETQIKTNDQEAEVSEKLAQAKTLPLQKIEEKTGMFYILGSLIIILFLVFLIWFKL